MNFNLLAVIEAGHITEHDNYVPMLQNIEPEHAHAIAKWLALATDGAVELRLIGPGVLEEIYYNAEQLKKEMLERQHRKQQAEEAGCSDAESQLAK